ncbi:hypothetical protein CDCA_CDCA12G3350 [Cyanidium caldarium]|uniref:Uncharacterized protein n=1 Tax=Cyanidium caldarium TaxID=2771 RepID=A0AAV9IZ14_CYACA|nr:hypothetical protein CDCA_CDCA12G3350 [Cyanidium caldarium]
MAPRKREPHAVGGGWAGDEPTRVLPTSWLTPSNGVELGVRGSAGPGDEAWTQPQSGRHAPAPLSPATKLPARVCPPWSTATGSMNSAEAYSPASLSFVTTSSVPPRSASAGDRELSGVQGAFRSTTPAAALTPPPPPCDCSNDMVGFIRRQCGMSRVQSLSHLPSATAVASPADELELGTDGDADDAALCDSDEEAYGQRANETPRARWRRLQLRQCRQRLSSVADKCGHFEQLMQLLTSYSSVPEAMGETHPDFIASLPSIKSITDDRQRERVVALKLYFCSLVPSLPEWMALTDENLLVEYRARARYFRVLAAQSCATADSDNTHTGDRSDGESSGDARPHVPQGMHVGLLHHAGRNVGSLSGKSSWPKGADGGRRVSPAPDDSRLFDQCCDGELEVSDSIAAVVGKFAHMQSALDASDKEEEEEVVVVVAAAAATEESAQGNGEGADAVACGRGGHAPDPPDTPFQALRPGVQIARDLFRSASAGLTPTPTPTPTPSAASSMLPPQRSRRCCICVKTPADLMDLKRALLVDLLDAAEHARQQGTDAFTRTLSPVCRPHPEMPFVLHLTANCSSMRRVSNGRTPMPPPNKSDPSRFFLFEQLPLWVNFLASNLFRPLPTRRRLTEPEYIAERELPPMALWATATTPTTTTTTTTTTTMAASPDSTRSTDGSGSNASPAMRTGHAASDASDSALAVDHDALSVPEEDIEHPGQLFDWAWPHLELVYSLFIELLLCRVGRAPDASRLGDALAARHFTPRFLRSLLALFASDDARERDALRTVVHRLYARYSALRKSTREAMVDTVLMRPLCEDDALRQLSCLRTVRGTNDHHKNAYAERASTVTALPLVYQGQLHSLRLPEAAALGDGHGVHLLPVEALAAGVHPAAQQSSLQYNGVSEVLEVLAAIVAGYSVPLRPEHRLFYRRVLLPLHKPRGVMRYHRELTMCVSFCISKEVSLGVDAVRALLRYWPVTSTRKELLFLAELNEVLTTCGSMVRRRTAMARDGAARRGSRGSPSTGRGGRSCPAGSAPPPPPPQQQQQQHHHHHQQQQPSLADVVALFGPVMRPLFRCLARCLQSCHVDVSERTIYLISNQELMGELVEAHKAAVYPLLVPALQTACAAHWSPDIRHAASVLLGLVQRLDAELFKRYAVEMPVTEHVPRNSPNGSGSSMTTDGSSG